jgi:hypothetical protein
MAGMMTPQKEARSPCVQCGVIVSEGSPPYLQSRPTYLDRIPPVNFASFAAVNLHGCNTNGLGLTPIPPHPISLRRYYDLWCGVRQNHHLAAMAICKRIFVKMGVGL